MKLWLKLSLVCIVVLLLIVGACSTLLLVSARNSIVQMALDRALDEQRSLQTSVSAMTGYYGKADTDKAAKRSLVKYCFARFAKDTAVLMSDSEVLSSNVDFSPAELLPLTVLDEQNHLFREIGTRDILIVGSKVNILKDPYSIFTVSDITPVYEGISEMIWRFVLISTLCIAVGIALIVLLVRYATKPLKNLGTSARRIAQGDYNERVGIAKHDEVGALSEDFNAMAQAVEDHVAKLTEFNERQQLFIGGLTHEFKTPLTSIIGHSETLIYTNMPPESVENSLFHIHEQCKWLERLTQKLLKLVTLKEELTLKEQSVDKLLDAVEAAVSETLYQRGVNLAVAYTADTLPMDLDLMKSMLINLVDNAAKASRAGQTVELTARGRIIEIADHGVGIPKEELQRVTEPFYMVDKSRSKQLGGSGLGLALVQRIAQAHGAQLVIDSVLGQGTTVRLVFPDNKTITT